MTQRAIWFVNIISSAFTLLCSPKRCGFACRILTPSFPNDGQPLVSHPVRHPQELSSNIKSITVDDPTSPFVVFMPDGTEYRLRDSIAVGNRAAMPPASHRPGKTAILNFSGAPDK
ncbi:hypothetical protein BDW67DRAFT_150481 [Aspergillus spinulosporus]